GQGYFAVAVLLWAAGCYAGHLSIFQMLAAAATGVLLWALYFTLGFRAFARGLHANGFGMVLTVGLPLLAFLAYQAGWPRLSAITPPGNVQAASRGTISLEVLCGCLLAGSAALIVARRAL